MPKSVLDCHLEIISKLRKRGEVTLLPEGLKPMGGEPYIYMKGTLPQDSLFICGHGIIDINGKVRIHHARDGWEFAGSYQLKDLGICDPICWYAHLDKKLYGLATAEAAPKKCFNCRQWAIIITRTKKGHDKVEQCLLLECKYDPIDKEEDE